MVFSGLYYNYQQYYQRLITCSHTTSVPTLAVCATTKTPCSPAHALSEQGVFFRTEAVCKSVQFHAIALHICARHANSAQWRGGGHVFCKACTSVSGSWVISAICSRVPRCVASIRRAVSRRASCVPFVKPRFSPSAMPAKCPSRLPFSRASNHSSSIVCCHVERVVQADEDDHVLLQSLVLRSALGGFNIHQTLIVSRPQGQIFFVRSLHLAYKNVILPFLHLSKGKYVSKTPTYII